MTAGLARVAAVLAALAAAGCVSLPSRNARLDPCACGAGRWTLALQVPSGSLKAGGPSLAIYREQRWYAIVLPTRPTPETQRYGFEQVELRETGGAALARMAVTAGYVEIDRQGRRADVELTTADGPFVGNGIYPLE